MTAGAAMPHAVGAAVLGVQRSTDVTTGVDDAAAVVRSPGIAAGTRPSTQSSTHPDTSAMQDRFLEVLAASPAQRPTALPHRFQPLARGLTQRPVLIAHDSTTRAALRAVNRPAATLGNVLHLQRSPDDSAATHELIAHELVHAASAPTRPRFYAEPGHDHEEHRAMQVGLLARASRTSAVDASALPLAKGAPVLPRVVQRTEAAPTPAGVVSSAVAPVSAASPSVQRSVGGSTGTGGSAVSGSATSMPSSRSAQGTSTSAGSRVQRSVAEGSETSSAVTTNGLSSESTATTSARLNDFEELVEMIERRVLNELERRGGRVRGAW
jgi:hypothetical protein